MSTTQLNEEHPLLFWQQLDDGTTPDDPHDTGADPLPLEVRYDTLRLFNTDSIAHHIHVHLRTPTNDTRDYPGVWTVPAAVSGEPGTFDVPLNLPLPAFWAVKWSVHEAINSGKVVESYLIGGTL
jgi:hypothetical protein